MSTVLRLFDSSQLHPTTATTDPLPTIVYVPSSEVAHSQESNMPTTAPPGLGGPTATTSPTSHHKLGIDTTVSSAPQLPTTLRAQARPFSPVPAERLRSFRLRWMFLTGSALALFRDPAARLRSICYRFLRVVLIPAQQHRTRPRVSLKGVVPPDAAPLMLTERTNCDRFLA